MEPIQKQITTLAHKVDLVYEILDRLYHNVADNADNQIVNSEETSQKNSRNHDEINRFESMTRRNSRSNGTNYRHDSSDWAIAQQDILIDSSGVEVNHHQIKEQDLSPQVQIQRLTAQLTAAYNRIAALEEQLLAKRWK